MERPECARSTGFERAQRARGRMIEVVMARHYFLAGGKLGQMKVGAMNVPETGS